jgi:hypothetical protein
MAKRGRKGGSSAARSAAAKKGWETRRRGGGAAKGKGKTKATAPSSSTISNRQQIINDRKRAIRKKLRLEKNVGYNRNADKVRYMNSQNKTASTANGFAGKGSKAARRAAQVTAKAAQAKRSKQFSSKVAPNTAKAKYKAARSAVRELKMYRGGKTDATVKKAEAKVRRMERGRRASRSR